MSTKASLAPIRALATVLSLMAILTGCGLFNAGRIAPAPTNHSVALSRECERLAVNVDDPVFDFRALDPWYAIGQYAVALGIANANIDATRECQARQRSRLLKGK